jgi:hypothetical protein
MCPRYEGRASPPPVRVALGSRASEPPQHRLPALGLKRERRHGDLASSNASLPSAQERRRA